MEDSNETIENSETKERFVDILQDLFTGLWNILWSVVEIVFALLILGISLCILMYITIEYFQEAIPLLFSSMALIADSIIRLFSKLIDSTFIPVFNKATGNDLSAELGYAKLGITKKIKNSFKAITSPDDNNNSLNEDNSLKPYNKQKVN